MEKLEGIIIIIVVLAGIVGLYFIYSGVGFGIKMEEKEYCLTGQDITFRLVGGLEPRNSCEFRFTYRPPEQTPIAETGVITLAGIMGGKAIFDMKDSSGEFRTPGLAELEVWSDDVIAIMVKRIDERRKEVVAEFQSNRPEICIGGYVWDYDIKRRVCSNLESYAQQEFKLRKGIWSQSQPVPT